MKHTDTDHGISFVKRPGSTLELGRAFSPETYPRRRHVPVVGVCRCGCGGSFKQTYTGRQREYVKGHATRVAQERFAQKRRTSARAIANDLLRGLGQ